MSRKRVFVASLVLDLDLGLVFTPIRFNYVRSMEMVDRMHNFGDFGLVSKARFLVVFHDTMSNTADIPCPMYRKVNGVWEFDPLVVSVVAEPFIGSRRLLAEEYRSYDAREGNSVKRGPCLVNWWAKESVVNRSVPVRVRNGKPPTDWLASYDEAFRRWLA